MKLRTFVVAMLLAGPAAAIEPVPPTSSRSAETRPPLRRPWAPIELFYRQSDMDRQNVGARGRINATRDEQRVAETPSLQPPPLSDWLPF